jgi:putative ABC transport system permease protein
METRGALRKIRRVPPTEPDNFEISSNESLMRHFLERTRSYRLGAAIVGSIALFAAGIGIMNIMLVAVTERTREIGVRCAVGARRSDIIMQFIVEAVVTCQIGGVVGIALGILAGNLGAHYLLHLAPAIPYGWVGLGFVICGAVGVVFGTYPALKAANVDPIEALRYE